MEVQEAQETPQEPGPERVRPARRRGRTTLLIATAAALGAVAGICTGYLVQADRKPTPLPPLSQPVVEQSKGKAPEPLSAAQDRKVKTDGDLRKLLLMRPSGARDAVYPSGHDGWLSLIEDADSYTKPDQAFSDLVADEFRRAAVTSWRVGSTYTVEIRLVQYRGEENGSAAADAAEGQMYWAEKEGGSSEALPGTGDGMVYAHDKPDQKPGYLPVYEAEAIAWRGDIAMQIWVYDTKPIPKEKIMDLAKRQMGRL
ncbi:hypothetical protein ABT009_35665 [Streptomyces sp. NPDC002896]|uniref:hypothetical protein n=1 Tax=Streptomyces sp. NPDC002896 TaxID=3154438 RepID=UPI00332E260F